MISFSRPGKSWDLVVAPGKSWKINRLSINAKQCRSKVEKLTDKSKNKILFLNQ